MNLGEEECYSILSLSLSLGKDLLLLFLLSILGLISVMWGLLSVFSQQVKQFLSDWNQLCSAIDLPECFSLLILKILGKKFTNDSDKILKSYIFFYTNTEINALPCGKKCSLNMEKNHKMGNNIVWNIWCIKKFTHGIKYEGDGYSHFTVGLYCVSGLKVPRDSVTIRLPGSNNLVSQ